MPVTSLECLLQPMAMTAVMLIEDGVPIGTLEPPDGVDAPLTQLLAGVLTGVCRDLPGQVGTAVSVAHPAPERGAGRLQVLAATGVGYVLPPVTTGHLWGPSLLAAAGEESVTTSNLWHDPRWPHLTLDAIRAQLPETHHAAVSQVRGVGAVPGVWSDDGVVVLSAYLTQPADERTLTVLARHERLVTSAITIADIATRSAEETDQILDALASRAAIEQTKGAIMTLRRCDADAAWTVLQRASQEFNIKVRELAVALIEHIGHAPANQPTNGDKIVPGQPARSAAEIVWQAVTSLSPPDDRDHLDNAS